MFALRIRRQGQTTITLTRFRAATLTRVISLKCYKLLRISTSKIFFTTYRNCFMALRVNSEFVCIYICNRRKKYTMYCSLMFKKWNRYVFKFHLVEALVMSIKNLHEYLWSNCAFNMTHVISVRNFVCDQLLFWLWISKFSLIEYT